MLIRGNLPMRRIRGMFLGFYFVSAISFLCYSFVFRSSSLASSSCISSASPDDDLVKAELRIIAATSPFFTRLPRLEEIMSKQYGVPYGKHDGAPYKKILYWNSFTTLHNSEQYGMGIGKDGYKNAGCPVWQCETSQDRSKLTQYDAILFNFRSWNGSDLPSTRLPHQRYIFFGKEAPSWGFDHMDHSHLDLKYFFNWTMTYRWDSDVVHPYGWIEPLFSNQLTSDEKRLIPSINYAANKTKMAVWFNSNCMSMSGRQQLVDQLIDLGIQVDIYGACGNLSCSVTPYEREDITDVNELQRQDEHCREMAAKKYKFYLALENSNCLHYITEKFFSNMRHPILPIVMDVHGHHSQVAPPHSFINALEFPSVRHLANYLQELDRNDTLYNEYFWWKDHYRVRNGIYHEGLHYKTFCNLCAALHDASRTSRHQVYESMRSWWESGSDCRSVHYSMDDTEKRHYTRHPPFCFPSNLCLESRASQFVSEDIYEFGSYE